MGSTRQVLEISEITILICSVSNKLKYKERLFENDHELDLRLPAVDITLSWRLDIPLQGVSDLKLKEVLKNVKIFHILTNLRSSDT